MFMKNKIVQSGQTDGSAGEKMSVEVNQQEDWMDFNDRVSRRKKSGETKTMTTREEYYLKQKIRQQQRQLEGLQKELKNSTKIKEGMLTERERLVLHFSCMATIVRTTGIEQPEEFTTKIIEEVRRERCRSLSPENIDELLGEINEEMQAGKLMFKHLTDEIAWQFTGVQPDNNSQCCEDEERSRLHGHINDCDWRDMK